MSEIFSIQTNTISRYPYQGTGFSASKCVLFCNQYKELFIEIALESDLSLVSTPIMSG